MDKKEFLAGVTDFDMHRAYYGQMVDANIRSCVIQCIGEARIIASPDPHLNDIDLREWDNCASRCRGFIAKQLTAHGDVYSLGGAVAVLKEAARQIKENP